MKTIIVLIVVMFLLSVTPVQAEEVTVTWEAPTFNMDGSPITDEIRYNYHCWYGKMHLTVQLGNVLIYTRDYLPVEYLCRVETVNSKGNKSGWSNKVEFEIKNLGDYTNPPTNVRIVK